MGGWAVSVVWISQDYSLKSFSAYVDLVHLRCHCKTLSHGYFTIQMGMPFIHCCQVGAPRRKSQAVPDFPDQVERTSIQIGLFLAKVVRLLVFFGS